MTRDTLPGPGRWPYMDRLHSFVEEYLWRQGTPAEVRQNEFRGYDWSNAFMVVRVLQPEPEEAEEIHVIIMNVDELVVSTAGFRHCNPNRVAQFVASHF